MYKKILVPLDGSELAEVAIPYAEELATAFGSEIHLIGVEEFRATDALGYMPEKTRRQPQEEPAKFGIEEYFDTLVKKGPGFKWVSRVGHPATEIVKYAEDFCFHLIVIASHGRSGIKRWALGSVADKVVRSLDKPVLLIRAQRDHTKARGKKRFEKIILSLDGSPESETILPYVEELASGLKSEVTLLRTINPLESYYGFGDYIAMPESYTQEDIDRMKIEISNYLEDIGNTLKASGISIKTAVPFGDPAEEIIDMADKIDADLVAMATHGRSGINRLTFGSVADRVLHHGSTPLLLVRAQGDSEP